jgi:hypothetical protein
MVEKAAEEFVGRYVKYVLKNEDNTTIAVREKVILDQLEDFTLICGGFLEHFWVGGSDEARGENPEQRGRSARRRERCARGRRMVVVERGDLGFNLSPLFIAIVVNGDPQCFLQNFWDTLIQ